jgi:pimeloyl-ACP methyl ester carboxylesterase
MALDTYSDFTRYSPETRAAGSRSANFDPEPPPAGTYQGEIAVAGTTSAFTVEVPENPVDQTVNVIIYGFAGCDAVYRGLAKAMTHEQNLITMTCHLARFQHPKAALHPSHLTKPTALTSKIVRASIGALPDLGLSDHVNLFGHSMGGWIGTELAVHKPHLVDKLTLFGSAGLIDHSPLNLAPAIPKLLGRIAYDLSSRRPDAVRPVNAYETLKHVASNPLLTISEALTVSVCDVRETLQSIDGPALAILHPTDDEFFDSQKVSAEAAKITPYVKLLEGLGHGVPITHPSEVAEAYADMLTTMNQSASTV